MLEISTRRIPSASGMLRKGRTPVFAWEEMAKYSNRASPTPSTRHLDSRTMRLPIVSGSLRGLRWHLASRGQPGRILTGSYEIPQTEIFTRIVAPGATVLDLGAHAGYYTLLSARLVGVNGSVWGFEPNPRNFRDLQRNVRINGLANVRLEQVAVSDSEGLHAFDAGSGSGTGSLSTAGAIEVRTVTLDSFCEQRGILPSVIKIDVEGAELRVLNGARALLLAERPSIMLSTHGEEVHLACVEWLRDAGYSLSAITGSGVESTSEVLAVRA
jgi:FkbM family methyltransferase